MKLDSVMTPDSANSLDTSPMRRMFSSRSSAAAGGVRLGVSGVGRSEQPRPPAKQRPRAESMTAGAAHQSAAVFATPPRTCEAQVFVEPVAHVVAVQQHRHAAAGSQGVLQGARHRALAAAAQACEREQRWRRRKVMPGAGAEHWVACLANSQAPNRLVALLLPPHL